LILAYAGAEFAHASALDMPTECSDALASVRDEQPITCISHEDADAYCRYVHKRLPTRDEWEFAARGVDRRRFPWGDTYSRAGLASGELLPINGQSRMMPQSVGTHPLDTSPFGATDMYGGIREWTATAAPPPPDSPPSPPAPNLGPQWVQRPIDGQYFVACGQDWRTTQLLSTDDARTPDEYPSLGICTIQHARARGEGIGVRCVSAPHHPTVKGSL